MELVVACSLLALSSKIKWGRPRQRVPAAICRALRCAPPPQVAADVDVLYQTRIQKERFQDRPDDYEKAKGAPAPLGSRSLSCPGQAPLNVQAAGAGRPLWAGRPARTAPLGLVACTPVRQWSFSPT